MQSTKEAKQVVLRSLGVVGHDYMYYVYILKLSNGDYYTGRSDNLKRRFNEHTSGQERTAKNFLPVELVTYMGFVNKTRAVNFEKYLKTGSGKGFRNKHLV